MSKSHTRLSTPNTVEAQVLQLGEAIHGDAVLAGSAAIPMALADATRIPGDINLTVPETTYRYLRGQPEWAEIDTHDARLLTYGNYAVGMQWAGVPHTALRQRSWQSEKGIAIACLADIYAQKQARGLPQDKFDTALIRSQLQDHTKPPLPYRIVAHESAMVRSILPERLQHDSEAQTAIYLAANGLARVFTQYGDPRIGRVNQIIGDLELAAYGVPATYHNGFDVLQDMLWLQQHFDNIAAPDEDRLLGIIADAYSDSVYGHGRYSHNPTGHDELRSANLLAAHALTAGFARAQATRLRNAILGTTFDEQTFGQRGHHASDQVVQAVSGVDLQVISTPELVVASFDLAIEDSMSARSSKARTIGRVFAEHSIRISATGQALECIDEFAGARPAGMSDSPTVMQAFAGRFANNAQFNHPDTGYKPPKSWTLHRPAVRLANSAFLQETSQRLMSTDKRIKLSAVQAYERAQTYVSDMRRKSLRHP